MTHTDILLVAALAVFVFAWWRKRTPSRPTILLAAAATALAASVIGIHLDRWQASAGLVVAAIFLVIALIKRRRKTPENDRVPWVSGSALALLAILAVSALLFFPAGSTPKPGGRYAVGARTFELDDATRAGVLLAAHDQPRRLLVRVWYPAERVSGLHRLPYFTPREAETTARSLGEPLGLPFFFTYLRNASTHSLENAPLLAGATRLPVVIYSHGYGSFLSQNTALMEDLASHGYVVYSLQHTFDSATTLFPNGDVLPMDPALIKQMKQVQETKEPFPPRFVKAVAGSSLDERLQGHLDTRLEALTHNDRITAQSAAIWLADRIFLHDQLQQHAVPESVADIVAASALDRVGEMGMSFGGSTAGALCVVDSRCAAGINLDGADFHFDAFDADVRAPFLMFHSDPRYIYQAVGVEPRGRPRSFNEFSYERIATAGTRDDVLRIELKGTQHLGLSDLALFMRRPLRNPLIGNAPARVMIGAQNDFVRGFFDRYLRGASNNFPAAQLAAYSGWVSPIDVSDLRAWWAAKTDAERAATEARIEQGRRPMH